MNLIEQLGGYEKVKSIRDINIKEFDGDASGVTIHYMGNLITQEDIEKALLEYRRANGIFEPDDYIINDGELKVFAMWSSAVEGCAYIGYAYAENGEMAHKDEFRHATDLEITPVHRL